MAAFATFAAAEARAVLKMGDGTWVVAHPEVLNMTNSPAVRFQRYLSPTHPDYGAWVETTDDSAT